MSANDTFTDSDATELSTHTMDSGDSWVEHTSSAASMNISGNKITSAANGSYYANVTPSSADYDVEIDCTDTPSGFNSFGVLGRIDTAAQTYYYAFWHGGDTNWQLRRLSSGSSSTLGSYTGDSPVGATKNVRLSMVGSAIKVYIDDVERISVTNSDITSAGKPGLRGGDGGSGIKGDNWSFTDAAASSSNLLLQQQANAC